MPAVAAAACMEYCGVALKVGSISDARRDVGQRLQDLETTADQLVGEQDVRSPSECGCMRARLSFSRLVFEGNGCIDCLLPTSSFPTYLCRRNKERAIRIHSLRQKMRQPCSS